MNVIYNFIPKATFNGNVLIDKCYKELCTKLSIKTYLFQSF